SDPNRTGCNHVISKAPRRKGASLGVHAERRTVSQEGAVHRDSSGRHIHEVAGLGDDGLEQRHGTVGASSFIAVSTLNGERGVWFFRTELDESCGRLRGDVDARRKRWRQIEADAKPAA